MNPLGLLVLALGVVIIIVGVKGSQHNLVAALTNRKQQASTAGSSNPSSSSSLSKGVKLV
jgi:hypothetical protein